LPVHEDVGPGEADERFEQQTLPDPAVAVDRTPSAPRVAQVAARIAERMNRTAEASPPERRSSDAVLEVQCLGDFNVSYGGKRVYPQAAGVRHHQSWEILAMVAAQPNGMIAKEKVAAAMWPEATPLEVKNRLNQALRRLRIMIREQAPEAKGEFVRIVAPGFCRLEADVWCDVQHFVELCHKASRSADMQEAKHAAVLARALYGDDLLTDMPFGWLHERAAGLSLQERYRQDFCALTAELARRFMEEGQAQLAAPLYKELLAREPTLEDVVRDLYRCYAAMGNRAALVQEHRHLQEVLTEMFNGDPLAKPQPETIAAYQEALDNLRTQAAGNAELAATA
jgi:DNA-binding SARP family transcriptional activator